MPSGGGGGSNTTVQKADPWVGQQPYLQNIFSEAQGQYQSGGPQYYPGQTVVPYSPQEQVAQQQLEQYALGGAQQQAGQAQGAQSFLLGPALFPDTNPALAATARGAISPIVEQLTENVLPGIDRGAVLSGAYGGSRHGIAQGQAIDKSVEDMLATTAGLYSQGYGQGLDAMTKGLALSPQTMQLGTAPSSILAGTGQMDRELLNALVQEDVNRYNFAQQAPSTALAQYQQLIQGNFGGQSTATTDGGSRSPIASGIGGAIGGFSAGSMLGPMMGFGAGPAGAVGAGLGLLMGIL